MQATGKARYSDDVPVATDALWAAWVTSSVAKGSVTAIDTSAALAVPGVVRFVSYQDVPVRGVVMFDERRAACTTL
jgi:CO/xanthine dehydrogenase Mo-binding subunit